MNIIQEFAVRKKTNLYLTREVDDTTAIEFRKLKGRYYRKKGHWVFPLMEWYVSTPLSSCPPSPPPPSPSLPPPYSQPSSPTTVSDIVQIKPGLNDLMIPIKETMECKGLGVSFLYQQNLGNNSLELYSLNGTQLCVSDDELIHPNTIYLINNPSQMNLDIRFYVTPSYYTSNFSIIPIQQDTSCNDLFPNKKDILILGVDWSCVYVESIGFVPNYVIKPNQVYRVLDSPPSPPPP